MGVGQVLVGRDEFTVHVDVEHTVYAGNQVELGYVLAGSAERLARHPGGAQGVASMLAILQAYLESVVRHSPTSRDRIQLSYALRWSGVNEVGGDFQEKKAAARFRPCRRFLVRCRSDALALQPLISMSRVLIRSQRPGVSMLQVIYPAIHVGAQRPQDVHAVETAVQSVFVDEPGDFVHDYPVSGVA